MIVKLKNVRLAFPVLFTPRTVNGEGEPAFGATFVFDGDHEARRTMNEAIQEVGSQKWTTKWPEIKKSLIATDKICLHNGDSKSEYEGFAGNYFVSARNKVRPGVFDRDPNIELIAADGKPYAGCYVNASLDIWAMDNKYGKRICASLRGVQFFADGDAFGGGRAATSSDFDSADLESGASAAADFI